MEFAHLAVEGNHARVACPERLQRIAIGSAGGDLRAWFVHRQRALWDRRGRGLASDPVRVIGRRSTHDQVALTAELGDRSRRHVLGKRLAVPPLEILDFGEAVAFLGFGEDHRRPPVRLDCLRERVVQRREIVPVDLQHPGAERFRAARIGAEVPAQLGWSALTESVHVDEHDQVRQFVVAGFVPGIARIGHDQRRNLEWAVFAIVQAYRPAEI